GCMDPNQKVAGKGINRLREAGIEVQVGVLETECREANRRFLSTIENRRPYIILKWAESADGFLSPASKTHRLPVYISNPLSRQLVHKWRTEEDAILVGATTVRDDDPLLDARSWQGNSPIKIILDRSGCVKAQSRIFASGRTIVFSG